MKNILKSISILRGVDHACIFQYGKEPVSNFPDKFNNSMVLSYDLIDQIFSALKAIDKSHNEIYFSISDKFLVAYSIHEKCIVLLLTEKKINFPLLNMGIKSARMKIQRLLKEEQKLETLLATPPPQPIEQKLTANREIQSLLAQLSEVLKQYLGPAALFVFENDVKKWNKTYVQSHENLPHLIEIIKKELDPKTEQKEFVQQARAIIGRI